MNERLVKLTSRGELLYYDIDKPTLVKERVNLTHPNVVVRFVYAGRRAAQGEKPLPDQDDEFKLTQKGETFFFKDVSN